MSKTAIQYLGAATLAASLALLPSTASASPSGLGASSPVGAAFSLSVHDEAGALIEETVLLCDPSAGSHPRPREACAQLETADWQPQNLASTGDPCTREYAPVTVSLQGDRRAPDGTGQPVGYRAAFANRCLSIVETGGILFDF